MLSSHLQTPEEIDATPIPRTVKSNRPRAWDGAGAVCHTEGLLVDPLTGEALSDDFWTASHRGRLVIVTDSPAALTRDVETAGGTWQGHLYRRRGWRADTGQPARDEAEQSAITRVKLPGADRWHVVVCAHLFLDDLPPARAPDRIRQLIRFTLDYLDWCEESGWAARPSRGSWGAAFLRDPRFWPEARRKVPRIFNRIGRRHLPGNHYERLSDAAEHAAAVEVDMSGAHHQSAARARFPHPDHVGKAGGWSDPDRLTGCCPGHVNWPAALRVLARPGLFRLGMRFPAVRDDELAPPWWPRAGGEAVVTLHSPDLRYALERGAVVLTVVATMTSREECDGLNRYATWAQAEIAKAGEYRKTWLKGVLLAAYGVLAQGARAPSVVSSTPTARSSPATVVVGGELVDAHVAESRRATEPGYVDCLARGIIESETRVSLFEAGDALARGMGRHRMLALVADSALVAPPMISEQEIQDVERLLVEAGAYGYATGDWTEDRTSRAYALDRIGVGVFLSDWKERGPARRPCPEDFAEWFGRERMPGLVADILDGQADWRVKQVHTNLRFPVEGSAVHRVSDQTDKRPGVPRGTRAREPA